jgi:HemY protein
MKWFTLFFVAMLASLSWFFLEDPGFIVIGHGAWTIETSLSAFIIALLLVYLILRIFMILIRFPLRFFQNRFKVQQEKAQESLLRGLLALIQKQWQQAEQAFLKNVSAGELESLHYLGVAYAANKQQLSSRFNDAMEATRKSLPKDNLTVLLFEAQLHLEQHDLLAALEKTQAAYTLAPKHEQVLLLLLTLYTQLADWQALLGLLPELRKRKLLSAEQLQGLENRASIELIHHTLRTHPSQVTTVWSRMPKMMRLRPVILQVYIKHLMNSGDAATAEPLLREALKYQWDTNLVALYGELETPNTSQQISYAETWLKNHAQDTVLLQTLGQLCLRNRTWDKAQQYLESNISFSPTPKTYQLLAELSIQKGDPVQANEYYRRGLQLAM